MNKLTIAVLAGTIRSERKSIHAARLVFENAKEFPEIEAIFVDPINFNFPYDGKDEINKDPKYTEITSKADGFFIVTPEYNHSFPGSLKRMLDSELKNYIHKPVAFGGVSSGPWGGTRAIEALHQSVRALGLVSTFKDVHFPNISKIFDDGGKLLDERYNVRIQKTYKELIWMAQTLKYGRETII
jgi:NAD(P)H-dependent FMN reductase